MPFTTVAEAEARIAELEAEGKSLTRDLMTHKKGYKQLAEFLVAKGLDPSGNLDEQWEATSGKAKTELESQASKISKLEKTLEKLENEKLALSKAQEEMTIKGDLLGRMKDVIGAEDLADLWLAKGRVKLSDGKVVYVDKDKEIPVDAHLELYKKSFPDRVRVRQANGGQSANAQPDGQPQKKTMKMSEYKRLADPAKKDFLDQGGELVRE
jgi:predicted RNase H-like nuclease (RuvC/YqgF family)